MSETRKPFEFVPPSYSPPWPLYDEPLGEPPPPDFSSVPPPPSPPPEMANPAVAAVAVGTSDLQAEIADLKTQLAEIKALLSAR